MLACNAKVKFVLALLFLHKEHKMLNMNHMLGITMQCTHSVPHMTVVNAFAFMSL